MGIVEPPSHKQEHVEVYKASESSTKLIYVRYEVSFQWKTVKFRVADSEEVTKERLASLTWKAMLTKYDEAMRQYVEQGFA